MFKRIIASATSPKALPKASPKTPRRTPSLAPSRLLKTQGIIVGSAVTLLIISGILTGAWLNMDDGPVAAIKKKKKKKEAAAAAAATAGVVRVEDPVGDRIVWLEDNRARLVSARAPLERKLGQVRARIRARGEVEGRLGGEGSQQ